MSYRAKPKAKSSVSRGSALMFSGVYCKDIVVRSSTMLTSFINAHGIPPQRRYPDRPPFIVKGALLVAMAVMRID